MPGDYTRFSYKPQRRYSGVLMQQGRVQLDADWNELVQIFKRRWEVQAMDCVPRGYAAITPDAFQITVVQGPLDLRIGVGRMYVEGLLAEIFEGESFSYLKQPFYPAPPALPTTRDSVLVYLDVRDREVTWVQDHELLEKALQGPDTATRIQTIWQVKQTSGDCETDLAALFPPSAGRLSSRAQASPVADDPCIVSPTGGYRGVENRLYRVEIHDAGVPGDLTSVRFKWSRDNASAVSPVEEITTVGTSSELTVARIGRDQVLRFKVDDWVELLDDRRELMEQPGETARVVAIDEANRRITLDHVMPGDFDAADPSRHTRLIRWDQTQLVDADGLVPASSGWIALEDGIEVQLSLAPSSGSFHAGDYWVFAARTADGSVEELVDARPRGIVHHYVHLAAIAGLGTGREIVRDCRPPWCARKDGGQVGEPPAGGPRCCVVVAPGDSIQAALDALPAEGGCVCLKVGTHKVTRPIRIATSNVVLHGESLGAQVIRSDGVRALSITNRVQNVRVHGISFKTVGRPADDEAEIIALESCGDVILENCEMIAGDLPSIGPPVLSPAVAVNIANSSWVRVRDNEMASVTAGVLGRDSAWVQISDNRITFSEPATPAGAILSGFVGVGSGDEAGGPWLVERNRIENYHVGVSIGPEAERSVVLSNFIQRSPQVRDPREEKIFAVDIAASHCVARENTVHLAARTHAGIRATADHTRIENNRISSTFELDAEDLARPDPRAVPWGIFLGPVSDTGDPADHCVIQGNSLLGGLDAIRVRGTRSLDVDCVHLLGNRIGPLLERGRCFPRFAVLLERTRGAVVARNRIRDGSFGIGSSHGSGLRVFANDIENMSRSGISVHGFESASLAHNRVAWCAYLEDREIVPAVAVNVVRGDVRLESCEIVDTGMSREGRDQEARRVYSIMLAASSCQIESNRVAYSDLAPQTGVDRRALLVKSGMSDLEGGYAVIVDNCFSGLSAPPLVEILTQHGGFERVTYSNNHCDHRWDAAAEPTAETDRATVSLWGVHLIVMGNHVKASPDTLPSIDFNKLKQKVVVMGNITTGSLIQLVNPVPTPHDLFNVHI